MVLGLIYMGTDEFTTDEEFLEELPKTEFLGCVFLKIFETMRRH